MFPPLPFGALGAAVPNFQALQNAYGVGVPPPMMYPQYLNGLGGGAAPALQPAQSAVGIVQAPVPRPAQGGNAPGRAHGSRAAVSATPHTPAPVTAFRGVPPPV